MDVVWTQAKRHDKASVLRNDVCVCVCVCVCVSYGGRWCAHDCRQMCVWDMKQHTLNGSGSLVDRVYASSSCCCMVVESVYLGRRQRMASALTPSSRDLVEPSA